MEDYTGIENTEESELRTKAKKRLITVIVAAALVGLVVFLIAGGANALSCNPQDLNCAGNLPSGDLSSTSKNWFESLMSSVTGLFSITNIPTAEGVTQEYVWSDKITVPSGPYGGCELLYQCGDVSYVSKRDLGIQELKLGSTMEFDFSCRCSTTGIVSAKFGCWQRGYQSYYTAWSKVYASPCLFAPKETPTPCWQPPMIWTSASIPCAGVTEPTCTVVWNPPVCEGSNSVEKSGSCGSPNRKETPCTYGCNTATGKCNTQPTDGCTPVFRDKICENNIQYKVALNCGKQQKEAEFGCPNGCSGGVCASASQVTPTPTVTQTVTVTPTPTVTPTKTPTSTPTPPIKLSNDNFSPSQWKELCGIQDYTKLCPLGANDFDVTEWNKGCPSVYRCVSETKQESGSGSGAGTGTTTTSTKGFIGDLLDWLNNFIKGIIEGLFGKK